MELPDRVALEAAWAEGNAATGPHGLIRQPAMRLFWRRCFGAAEEVPWDAFWTRFPKDLERLCDDRTRLLLVKCTLAYINLSYCHKHACHEKIVCGSVSDISFAMHCLHVKQAGYNSSLLLSIAPSTFRAKAAPFMLLCMPAQRHRQVLHTAIYMKGVLNRDCFFCVQGLGGGAERGICEQGQPRAAAEGAQPRQRPHADGG